MVKRSGGNCKGYKNCRDDVVYGKNITLLHCENHKYDDEIMLGYQKCKSCSLDSILNDKGVLQRPDLIAIKDKTATIIDYKTGEPRSSYAEQLAGYSALLHQMGFEVGARLLVYIDSEEVESV
jgi:ATP-dependent exoDNAse (exonuclease V) beta subunit